MSPSGYKTKFHVNFTDQSLDLSKHFDLLAADGLSGITDQGFVIDSRQFTTTVPYGDLGRLDYYKWLAITEQQFSLKDNKTLFEAWISGEQFFDGQDTVSNQGLGFPGDLAPAVFNSQEDPRLASSGLIIFDEENDLMYGHILTNQAHYALYARSNFAQLAAIAPTAYVSAPVPPLFTGDTNQGSVIQLQQALIAQGFLTLAQITGPMGDGLGIYGPNTTEAVDNFQQSSLLSGVIPGVYDETTAITLFVASNRVMTLLGLACPLDEQNLQPAFIPPAIPSSIQPLNISGTAFQSARYKYGTCPGSCNKFTSRYGSKKACKASKCNPCGNGGNSSFANLVNLNARYAQNVRYTQPFSQIYGSNYFGTLSLAPHLNWVQLKNRESVSPISDFVKVGIEFDNSNGTVNYLINGVPQYNVVSPGSLLEENLRGVLQDGDITRTVSCNVRVAMGTFTFLDSALPNSYSRFNTGAQNAASTNALMPLASIGDYLIPYAGPGGQYGATTLGSTFFAFSTAFGNIPQASNRLFGQGAAMVIKSLQVSVCKGNGNLHSELEYYDSNACCDDSSSSSSSSSSSCSSSSSSSSSSSDDCCKKKKKCKSSSSSSSCPSSSSSSSCPSSSSSSSCPSSSSSSSTWKCPSSSSSSKSSSCPSSSSSSKSSSSSSKSSSSDCKSCKWGKKH